MPTNSVKATPLLTFNSASLTGTYQAINGPAGLPHECAMLLWSNDGSTAFMISYDGITDNEYILADSYKPLLFKECSLPNNNVATLSKGTIIYVKGTAGTGTIAASAYYV